MILSKTNFDAVYRFNYFDIGVSTLTNYMGVRYMFYDIVMHFDEVQNSFNYFS